MKLLPEPAPLLALVLFVMSGCRSDAVAPSAARPSPTEAVAQPSGFRVASAPARPSPAETGTQPSGVGSAELKYRLIDEFGPPAFCDPDDFPAVVVSEENLAQEEFPNIRSDEEAFHAITARLGLDPEEADEFTTDQKLAVYREFKTLTAVVLHPAEDGYGFDFEIRVADTDSGAEAAAETTLVTGAISPAAEIVVDERRAAGPLGCPT